jgi:arsenate reductase
MKIVIFHNPNCGTSRNVVQIVKDAGFSPTVVEYLDTGWTKPQLQTLFATAGLSARDALRTTKSPAEELGLMGGDVTEEQLLDAMVAHPILVNRPFVASKGTRAPLPPVGASARNLAALARRPLCKRRWQPAHHRRRRGGAWRLN